MSSSKAQAPEIDAYRDAVRKLAELNSSFIFKNSSHLHANIVLSTMLDFAKSEFRIYDDELSGDISETSPDFCESLESFVSKGKKLKIVLKNDTIRNSDIFRMLRRLQAKSAQNVLVSVASDNFKRAASSLFLGLNEINFALGDPSSFRLEETNGTREAYCSFNDKKFAERLRFMFDSQFDTCQPVSW